MSEMTRRQFVTSLVVAGGGLALAGSVALADTQPAPSSPTDTIYWAKMGPVANFKDGSWDLTPYPAEYGHKKAFVKVVGGTTVSALSPICPHQGCPVAYSAKSKQFTCPCHAAVFSDTGAIVSGPSTSPMTVLQSKIDGGNVMVQSLTPPKAAS